jgi:hypothetical protein
VPGPLHELPALTLRQEQGQGGAAAGKGAVRVGPTATEMALSSMSSYKSRLDLKEEKKKKKKKAHSTQLRRLGRRGILRQAAV